MYWLATAGIALVSALLLKPHKEKAQALKKLNIRNEIYRQRLHKLKEELDDVIIDDFDHLLQIAGGVKTIISGYVSLEESEPDYLNKLVHNECMKLNAKKQHTHNIKCLRKLINTLLS